MKKGKSGDKIYKPKEGHLETSQTWKMVLFPKIVNGCKKGILFYGKSLIYVTVAAIFDLTTVASQEEFLF